MSIEHYQALFLLRIAIQTNSIVRRLGIGACCRQSTEERTTSDAGGRADTNAHKKW